MSEIGYKRVSSVDQNLDRQLDGMIFDKVFEEKISGANTDRPQLKEMMEYAREGDTIHVHEISRLARNLFDLKRIVDAMTEKGATVHFHKENMVFKAGGSDPMTELLFHVMGAFAEFERRLIKERQIEGIAKAKEKGVYANRVQRHHLDPQKREECKKLLSETNLTKAEISRMLGISRGSVYNIEAEDAAYN